MSFPRPRSTARRRAPLLVSLALVLSCGDGSTEPAPRVPAALQVVSGNEQNGVVGAELPNPLVVRVVDDAGQPIPGQLVNFRVVAGGGSVFAGSGLTNAQGQVQERWTLGTSVGAEHRVEARAVDAETGAAIVFATFTATPRAAAPARLLKLSPDSQSVTVGSAVPAAPSVRVEDTYGNPVPGVIVTFAVVQGNGSVSGGTATSDANGVATAGGWTLGTVVGNNVLTASVSGGPSTSFAAAATVAAASRLLVITQPSTTARSRIPLAQQPAIRVEDLYGNPISDHPVTATIASGGGTLTGALTVRSDAQGISRFVDLALRGTAGQRVLAFSAAGVEGARSDEVALGAGDPSSVEPHAGHNQIARVATTLPVRPAARVVDADGNGVAGVPVSFTVVGGGGSITGPEATTDDEGIATVGSWTLGTTAGPNWLEARVSTFVYTRIDATGTPGDPFTLAKLRGDGQTVNIGTPVPINPAVQVRDEHGNLLSDVTVTFAIASGGGTVTGAVTRSGSSGPDRGVASVERWTLGPQPGANTLTASVEGVDPVTFTATGIPVISFHFEKPTAGALHHRQVEIDVRVNSRNQLSTVIAHVEDKSTPLVFNASTWRWIGTMHLEGVRKGELDLRVVATDVAGHSAEGKQRFVHDAPPTLTVIAPLDSSVGYPTLRVTARCEDEEGECALTAIEEYSNTLLASGTSEIDRDASVAHLEDRLLFVDFVARDARGQTARAARIVYAANTANLREIAVLPGASVHDASPERVLYSARDASSNNMVRLHLYDITARTDVVVSGDLAVEDPKSWYQKAAWLAPRGAIFVGGGRVREFRDGALLDHGPIGSDLSLRVRGRWAIWSNGNQLYLRDLDAGATELVSSTAANWYHDVTAAGEVVYWSQYEIWRYRGGQRTQLTSDDQLWNVYPITDGINVVFRKQTPCCVNESFWIALRTPDAEVSLTPPVSTRDVTPPGFYQANGGWVAYVRQGTSGVREAWIRFPDGRTQALTPSGAHASLEALGPDGSLVYQLSGLPSGRWLRRPPFSDAPRALPSAGRAFWIGDRLYMLIGRHLYEVNL